MLTARIKIGDTGTIADTRDYGLVYLTADNILGAPTNDFEATVYPEEEGEHVLAKTVDAPFDYKVRFFIKADGSLENANKKIAAFNAQLYSKTGDTKTFKRVYLYNDYKRVMIAGYPKPISEVEDFWRDTKGNTYDVVTVEWLIRASKPSLCDFNLLYNPSTGKAELAAGSYKITGAYTTLTFVAGGTSSTITPNQSGVFPIGSAGVLTVTGGDATTNITANS